jgi:hypothetical protein
MYRNSIIQYLLNSQWFAKEKSHRQNHDFEGQTRLPLVTLALILTAVSFNSSFIGLILNLNGKLLCWLIRFHVPLMFGKPARRYRVNSTASRTGLDITNTSKNLRHGQRSVQNPARLNRQVAMICALICVRISFAIPGRQFLSSSLFNSTYYYIDCFLSARLPTITQPSATTTEADDEAAMLAEFEANFS